jgi:aspartyl-tRNA(Asn)/glutamyl-tRNA(Gln) amidotransferase subunit A
MQPENGTDMSTESRRRAAAPETYLSGYFNEWSISELSVRLRSNQITSRHLTEQALGSIQRLNPSLNAFCSVDEAGSLDAAERADGEIRSGVDLGLLHGIPVAIKDIIDVSGQRTTCGSAIYAERFARRDAESVRRLKQAGAVIVGKTVMHEFAFGITGDRSLHGASRNPVDPTRMSGGSSGGSAVAVASGMVPLALGTDTAGSVRIPAALCGIVGYKPAFDAISTAGVYPLAPSLDHVGLFARTAGDVWSAYGMMVKEPVTSLSAPPENLNIGWLDTSPLAYTHPQIEQKCRQKLSASSITVSPAAFDFPEQLGEFFGDLILSEAHNAHIGDLALQGGIIDEDVRGRLQKGGEIPAWKYIRAVAFREEFRLNVMKLFGKYDLLALPTSPIIAPVLADGASTPATVSATRIALLALTSPWNLAGVPALSIPCGTVEGMPVGVQLICAPGSEKLLFKAAAKIEGMDLLMDA